MKPREYARRIRHLRARLRLTQHALAELLRVRPQVVASWEQGRRAPSAESYRRLAALASPKEAWFFLEQIGVTRQLVRAKWPGRPPTGSGKETSRPPAARIRMAAVRQPPFLSVPLLKKNRPLPPGQITAEDIETMIAIPAGSLPRKRNAYVGLRVRGDSMAPVLPDGFLAVIDRTLRAPRRLLGRMVAVGTAGGVQLRWLEPVEAGGLRLRPENPAYPAAVLDPAARLHLLGKVVFWWGAPR